MGVGERPRILHLAAPAEPAPTDRPARRRRLDTSDLSVGCCRACISATRDEFDHEVLIVGGSVAERRVFGMGLTTPNRVCPPGGVAALARRSVSRFVRRRGGFACVHCWGGGLIPAIPSRTPTVVSGFGAPVKPGGDALAIVSGDALARAWADRGWRVVQTRTPVVEHCAARNEARALLGAGASSTVIALLADPPAAGEARRFVLALGAFSLLHPDVVGVIPAGATQLARALSLHRHAGIDWRLVVRDEPADRWLAAADLAVHAPRADGQTVDTGTASLVASAHAAGIPVVSTLLAGEGLALPQAALAGSSVPADLTCALLRVWEDPERGAIARARGADAAGSMDEYVRAVRDEWLAAVGSAR